MEKQINMNYYRKLVSDVMMCSNAVQIADEIYVESEKWLSVHPNFYELFLQAIDEVYNDAPVDYNQYEVESFNLKLFSNNEFSKLEYAAAFALYKLDIIDKPIKEQVKNKFGISPNYYTIIAWVTEELYRVGYKMFISIKDSSKFARMITVDHFNMLTPMEKSLQLDCSTTQFVYICNKISKLTKTSFNICCLQLVNIRSKTGRQIKPGNFSVQKTKDLNKRRQPWQEDFDRIFEVAQQKHKNNIF